MAKNAVLDVGTRKLVTTEEDQEHMNYPEDLVSTGNLSPQDSHDLQEIQETQETREPTAMTKVGHTISTFQQNYVLHMEKVFSIVRQRYGLSSTDQMKNLDANTAT